MAKIRSKATNKRFAIELRNHVQAGGNKRRYRWSGPTDRYDRRRAFELKEMSYEEYLKTSEWRIIRSAALIRAKWTCQVCGAKATDVHHRVYTTRGQEQPEDLVVVCASCHKKLHEKSRRGTCSTDRPSSYDQASSELKLSEFMRGIIEARKGEDQDG